MSAHFDVNKISFFGLDEWSVAVCAWRGCCLEIFSRAEHSVTDCLRALEEAGVRLGRDAHHAFPAGRLKALAAYIGQTDFGGHGKATLRQIAEWEKVYEVRAFLAHGTIRPTSKGLTIRHSGFDGKAETRHPPKHLSRLEMLETLADLERAQTRLHHQLGQIKTLAVRKKPDPGSSPG